MGPAGRVDYAGNWPQVFYLRDFPGYRVPEVSPFVVAFIHHALTFINEESVASLGLSMEEARTARELRRRAVHFLRRFESRPDAPDAGAFAFWPYDQDPIQQDLLLESVLFNFLGGPVLGGQRAPINLFFFPSPLAIPADADVTATTFAVLLDDAQLDGGPGATVDTSRFFVDWRDTGEVPLRLAPDWLPHASGAYLTWLMYRESGQPEYGNDVDLVVVANVLYALARYGHTDVPGFAESAALLDFAVAQGLHRTRFADISSYYPDNYAFEYCVSRAFREGPIAALGPAVEQLADEIESAALLNGDGTARWDRGHPELNTAFAILTLLNAGRTGPLVAQGVAYLERRQHPLIGCWPESIFFLARGDTGREIYWASPALTTAMALEAICRHRLGGWRNTQ